jgi:hypothetical protein
LLLLRPLVSHLIVIFIIIVVIMGGHYFGGRNNSYYHHRYKMDEQRVDRSDWRDKSDAALRREHQAKELLDGFLQEAESMTTFPVTKDDLVPASIHLTFECWKSFKEYAVEKGCTTKRRVATMPERIATKDQRKGKMYVIAVTIPAHPSVAKDVALAKKIKDDAANVKKKKDMAARLAHIMTEKQALEDKAKQEFNALVRAMEGNNNSKEEEKNGVSPQPDLVTLSSSSPRTTTNGGSIKSMVDQHPPNLVSPTAGSSSNNNNKKRKQPDEAEEESTVSITVPRLMILCQAKADRDWRLSEVARSMEQEKRQKIRAFQLKLDETMQAKSQVLVKETEAFCDRVMEKIIALTE